MIFRLINYSTVGENGFFVNSEYICILIIISKNNDVNFRIHLYFFQYKLVAGKKKISLLKKAESVNSKTYLKKVKTD